MKTNKNKINIFFELSNEAFECDNDFLYEDLGVSKQDYLDGKLKMIKKTKLKSIAQFNKSKNENLLNLALQKIQNIIASTNDNLKEELAKIIHTRSPQFQFRNIEKLDKDDLNELLNDLDIINIVEDLDRISNDK